MSSDESRWWIIGEGDERSVKERESDPDAVSYVLSLHAVRTCNLTTETYVTWVEGVGCAVVC